MPSTRPSARLGIAGAAAVLLAVASLLGEGPPAASAAVTPFAFAPYVDVAEQPSFDLAGQQGRTGGRYYTLAFVDGQGGRCEAGWGSSTALTGGDLTGVAALRARGGDVAVAFGGARGDELARYCASSADVEAQYQRAIDAYRPGRLDFDLEGPALADGPSMDRRWRAVADLQAAARARGRPLEVVITLPVLPTGLLSDALAALRGALAAGVQVRLVNLLAMDYGHDAAPRPRGRMALYAERAATAAQRQLASLLPGSAERQRWPLIGLTLMVGRNDVHDEVVLPGDLRAVLRFARAHRLGALSLWSVNRDRPCPPSPSGRSPGTACSSVRQPPAAFSRVFAAFGS